MLEMRFLKEFYEEEEFPAYQALGLRTLATHAQTTPDALSVDLTALAPPLAVTLRQQLTETASGEVAVGYRLTVQDSLLPEAHPINVAFRQLSEDFSSPDIQKNHASRHIAVTAIYRELGLTWPLMGVFSAAGAAAPTDALSGVEATWLREHPMTEALTGWVHDTTDPATGQGNRHLVLSRYERLAPLLTLLGEQSGTWHLHELERLRPDTSDLSFTLQSNNTPVRLDFRLREPPGLSGLDVCSRAGWPDGPSDLGAGAEASIPALFAAAQQWLGVNGEVFVQACYDQEISRVLQTREILESSDDGLLIQFQHWNHRQIVASADVAAYCPAEGASQLSVSGADIKAQLGLAHLDIPPAQFERWVCDWARQTLAHARDFQAQTPVALSWASNGKQVSASWPGMRSPASTFPVRKGGKGLNLRTALSSPSRQDSHALLGTANALLPAPGSATAPSAKDVLQTVLAQCFSALPPLQKARAYKGQAR